MAAPNCGLRLSWSNGTQQLHLTLSSAHLNISLGRRDGGGDSRRGSTDISAVFALKVMLQHDSVSTSAKRC